MKIIVSAFSNLSTDQRIEKICQTLYDAGFSIHLIGSSWGDDSPVNRPYHTEKINISSNQLKIAYPEFNYKLYQKLKKIADKNTLLYCNDLDALLANHLVSKKISIPLIYDSHEIYTEMPTLQGRFTQKIWQFLEKNIISSVRYMITASNSYADWFVEKYNIPRPIVIQNFPKRNFSFNDEGNTPKIILYQGMLNPSRGLERMLYAMPYLEGVVLYIAGDGPIKKRLEELTTQLSLKDKVKFLGKVSPKNLVEITKKADIGLSIEENNGLSYYYSLPNKVSDYVQAGVPILTSNFPEMKNIVNKWNVGKVINNHSPEEIREKINELLNEGKAAYGEALRRAADELCWENEAKKLLSEIHRIKKENFG